MKNPNRRELKNELNAFINKRWTISTTTAGAEPQDDIAGL